jgi:two-component sensor histidine kinase
MLCVMVPCPRTGQPMYTAMETEETRDMIGSEGHGVASLLYATPGKLWRSLEVVGAMRAYVVAAGFVAASLLIREILTYAFGMSFPAVTFYPSVLVATLVGGLLPGLFATVLSTLVLWYVVLPIRFSFALPERAQVVDLTVFVVVNVGIAMLASHYRQLRMREGAEKRYVEFTLRELNHRVKNLLAVIQAISSQIAKRTHDIGEFQDAFYERIRSLAQSHDMLVKRNWQSVNVRDLIIAQLEVFDNSQQIKLEGETVFLSPTATEQLGLALYELGSNSMKYGVWKQGGNVAVSWRVLEDSTLEFVWRETGAAHKTDSGRKGFGHFVLTEVVPKNLRGQASLIDNPDGITWRLSMHSQHYSHDKLSPILDDGRDQAAGMQRASVHVLPTRMIHL